MILINVDTLIKKLTDGNRQMIVTTRQKMQTMVNKQPAGRYQRVRKDKKSEGCFCSG